MEVDSKQLLRPLAAVPRLNTQYHNTSYLARLYFWWTYPLMQSFQSAPLSPDSLMNLPPDFLRPSDRFHYSGHLALDIRRAYFCEVLRLGAQGVLLSVLNFLLPLYIVYVQFFIEQGRPVTEGLLSLVAVAVTMLLRALINSRQSLGLLRLRLILKNLLQHLIYSTALQLREGVSVGQAVNVLQVDAARVADSVPWAVNLLYYPFHFAFAVTMLCYLLGVAALVGLAFFIALFVFNFYLERSIHRINLRIMECKDERMKQTTELLTNIRPLKMLNWEAALLSKVHSARMKESAVIKAYTRLRTAAASSMMSAPALAAMLMLVTFVSLGGELTVSAAFGTLSTVFLLQIPLREFPSSASNLNQALAAAKRVDAFLSREKVESRLTGESGLPVLLKSASFSFTNTSEKVLHEVSLEVQPGEFVAVVGPVGSGKSGLLKAILGELHLHEGSFEVNGSVAYCGSIDSWIMNATIKDNIVIGREFSESRYQQVISACALLPDLQVLPAGDATEIGERGINLSGGQKARVALARAVYANADIYLLDDPLGAVDAHVRAHIFQRCFLGLLSGKTRVLATHSTEFTTQVNRVITLSKGMVEHIGTPTEAVWSPAEDIIQETVSAVEGGRLVREEERPHGEVQWAVYKVYFRYCGGGIYVFLVLASVVCWVSARVGADLSLKYWGETLSRRYMLSFIALSMAVIVFLISRTWLVSIAGIRAGNQAHQTALTAVVRAPINLYFDVTPLGRLLNRLSKDLYDMDIDLPFNFGSVVSTYAVFTGMLVVSVIFVPWILLLVPVLAWLAGKCQTLYLAGANNTNRMLRNANSPLVHHFTETIGGLKVIRSLGLQSTSCQTNSHYVDLTDKIMFNNVGTTAWLDLMLNLITVLYFLAVTGFLLLEHERLSAGAIGLIIAYMLPLPRSITMNTQFTSRLKTNMVSMERVHQLTAIAPEAPLTTPLDQSLDLWPASGSIHFQDVSLRYRPNTPVVLKGLDFQVEGGEKVGIVGRTGSGKSSIVQALFRIVELQRGAIYIDGVNIVGVGLSKLRSAMTLIPQDPLLFKGTMQNNLDPFAKVAIDKLNATLASVGLGTFTHASEIAEGGSNISSGERQLVCIARAALASTRILLMDEATSAVDQVTDETIHRLLRAQFSHCTILTIAHRLDTIMASDRVLVLEDGRLLEIGPPSQLAGDSASAFAKLLEELPRSHK